MFQPTVNSSVTDKQRNLYLKPLVSLQLLCVDIWIWVLGGVEGGEGGPFWLHRETLTFLGPTAYQNTKLFLLVNKIPPDFNTLFATSF